MYNIIILHKNGSNKAKKENLVQIICKYFFKKTFENCFQDFVNTFCKNKIFTNILTKLF